MDVNLSVGSLTYGIGQQHRPPHDVGRAGKAALLAAVATLGGPTVCSRQPSGHEASIDAISPGDGAAGLPQAYIGPFSPMEDTLRGVGPRTPLRRCVTAVPCGPRAAPDALDSPRTQPSHDTLSEILPPPLSTDAAPIARPGDEGSYDGSGNRGSGGSLAPSPRGVVAPVMYSATPTPGLLLPPVLPPSDGGDAMRPSRTSHSFTGPGYPRRLSAMLTRAPQAALVAALALTPPSPTASVPFPSPITPAVIPLSPPTPGALLSPAALVLDKDRPSVHLAMPLQRPTPRMQPQQYPQLRPDTLSAVQPLQSSLAAQGRLQSFPPAVAECTTKPPVQKRASLRCLPVACAVVIPYEELDIQHKIGEGRCWGSARWCLHMCLRAWGLGLRSRGPIA